MRKYALIALAFALVMAAAQVEAGIAEGQPGRWTGGAGLGFLANTPDGVAEAAIMGHADYFVTSRFSVGPLAQYSGAGNDWIVGLSLQGKYWWMIPETGHHARLVAQGGLGFVRAGITDADTRTAATFTSFLIPIGIGLDYTLTERLAVTLDLLVNFTSLGETVRSGSQPVDLHTNVMPGLYLGVRF